MMAIGQTFERQGRFDQAQYVYQRVLEQDPASPAAERLIAVVAAADVTNAQNLPVERLMKVGEFYERNGDLSLAQGIYNQVLHRQPGFAPAAERVRVIAEHQQQLISAAKPQRPSPTPIAEAPASTREIPGSEVHEQVVSGPSSADETSPFANPSRNVRLIRAEQPASEEAHSHGEEVTPAAGTQESSRQSDADSAMVPAVKWRARKGVSSGATLAEQDSADGVFELPGVVIDAKRASEPRVQQISAEEVVAANPAAVQIPPSPDDATTRVSKPTTSPGPDPAAPASGDRIAELWQDKPLGELKASIALKFPEHEPFRQTERDRLSQATPHMVARGNAGQAAVQSRPWMLTNYEWEAPATRHLPLWFEEPNLERMGYTWGMRWDVCGYENGPYAAECLQPIVSGAHFFGRVAFIPYMCGLDPVCEPIYTLGVDRPGSPVPYRRHLIPVTLKAALFQAGAMVGLSYIP
jgi:hypothetical protein